jgi:hypothetical protein
MTTDGFRRLAMRMPEAAEVGHMGHPDFRVSGRIFATLGYPAGGWAVVMLAPEQQEAFCAAEPDVFVPVKGKWGARGATNVRLRSARYPACGLQLAAWRKVARRRWRSRSRRPERNWLDGCAVEQGVEADEPGKLGLRS